MIELIQQRLETYRLANPVEEENALKEILQEILLFALWRADFFQTAAFQGGTSLRILHGMSRFSEDIDFILKKPDSVFSWEPFLHAMKDTSKEFGIAPEVLDRVHMERTVRAAVFKDSSIANQLNLSFMDGQLGRKLTIKLEIDTNPPEGSAFEYSYLDFPVDYEVCHQDLSSNFALKIHALLCRDYLKGRDWYDFGWYIAQGITPNLTLLQNALIQYGPWQGQSLQLDKAWLSAALGSKINEVDWNAAAEDVRRFLGAIEQNGLNVWSKRFFMNKLQKLEGLLSS